MDSPFLWSHPQMLNKSPTMSKTHANNSMLITAIKIPTHLKREADTFIMHSSVQVTIPTTLS